MWGGSLLRPGGAALGERFAIASSTGLALLCLLVYLGLDWMSFIHEHKGVPVTPWNPGLGFLFAMIALKGPAFGLVLFAGVAFAEIFLLRAAVGWPVVLGIASIISALYTLAGASARQYLRLDTSLASVRDVLVLLAAGAIGGLCVAALLGVLLRFAANFDASDLLQSVVPLFVGDLIGIAVITPLVLRFVANYQHIGLRRSDWALPELAAYVGAAAAALWLIVRGGDDGDYKFFSLLFFPVVAAALRYGIDGSCLTLAATQFSLVSMLSLHGYSATVFAEFQIVMLILTMTGLLVGVVVSERKQAEAMAQQAEEKFKKLQDESAQVMRSNMVSGMASALAHEISQPITAARALARSSQEMVRRPPFDLSQVESNLKTLVSQIDHAAEVVRRIREFMKRGRPRFSTLQIRSVIQNALVLARAEAAVEHTRLSVDVPERMPLIIGDAVQLQQVLLNLVRNGLEAIGAGCHGQGDIRVTARVESGGDSVSVSVEDNGIGVPEGLELFQPLSSSKPDGLGLGLSICASIVEAHGGRIRLEASRPGSTVFRFVLPIQPEAQT